ncbi:bifunctional DNA-formamidopyrimidine glycosylase/DNA-(apurinic or apyrimidinic site) lyase [Demequina aurantiaca]|uniref:bifunctional DNA-formamidopyrimidine glycosylase/DNA-(apurinic or apyrimidinic site) lyase n=1 Tax=Demequina aurantiaca TaxID=676200 RepID=UPI0007853BED|nr:bifunctional DNA-formamidopyrimidine glycosylase/DNA-(apurinic or apyrimidinic site) lyase [Demequina aurantiaca]
MPELPEVETVRVGLERLIAGAVIADVDIRRDSCVRLLPGGPQEFRATVTGQRIVEAARRGKFMWLTLVPADGADDIPREALSVHLGMSGQFRVHEGPWVDAPEPHSHCRARISLRRDDGAQLTADFLDQRTFGYLHVEPLVPTPGLDTDTRPNREASDDAVPAGAGTTWSLLPASVAHIGRDALDPNLDAVVALGLWRRGSRGIKQVLLDQTLVSGIGNIYADEALWAARVHPERPAHAVTRATSQELLTAARHVMTSALAQGGTSFDALYVNVNGESGYFSRSLEAYGREGEPCSRCGTALLRQSIGGRSTHWCPRCQRRWSGRRAR